MASEEEIRSYRSVRRFHDILREELGGLLTACYPDGLRRSDRHEAVLYVTRAAKSITEPVQLIAWSAILNSTVLETYIPPGFQPKHEALATFIREALKDSPEGVWMNPYSHRMQKLLGTEDLDMSDFLSGALSKTYQETPIYILDLPPGMPADKAEARRADLAEQTRLDVIGRHADGTMLASTQPKRPAKYQKAIGRALKRFDQTPRVG
ncbi:MAG: hypothetical protein SFW62_02915 [Alphaproteobacteria bacterium]|nr:hypothetical protein [Alphaproteobacteria bacterium]